MIDIIMYSDNIGMFENYVVASFYDEHEAKEYLLNRFETDFQHMLNFTEEGSVIKRTIAEDEMGKRIKVQAIRNGYGIREWECRFDGNVYTHSFSDNGDNEYYDECQYFIKGTEPDFDEWIDERENPSYYQDII